MDTWNDLPNRWMFMYRATHNQAVGRSTPRHGKENHQIALDHDNMVCKIITGRWTGPVVVEFEDGVRMTAYDGEIFGC